jgi:hypothetical protein
MFHISQQGMARLVLCRTRDFYQQPRRSAWPKGKPCVEQNGRREMEFFDNKRVLFPAKYL